MLFGNTNSHFDLAHDVIFSQQKELIAQDTQISCQCCIGHTLTLGVLSVKRKYGKFMAYSCYN